MYIHFTNSCLTCKVCVFAAQHRSTQVIPALLRTYPDPFDPNSVVFAKATIATSAVSYFPNVSIFDISEQSTEYMDGSMVTTNPIQVRFCAF
jgi:hypothetical protein